MIATICGRDLYWTSAGRGFPMVCLHGYGVDHRAIQSGMEPVCEGQGGFSRIYPDLPGMGQSQANDLILSSDDMLEVVCQFIDDIVGPEQPFVLAGYSYGGYLARGILYQMPDRVRGVLLVCPVTGFRRKGRILPAFKVWEQDPEFLGGMAPEERAQMNGFVAVQTRPVWEAYKAHILPALPLADRSLMERIRDSEFSFPVDRRERPYEMPAAILTGGVDVSVGYADALALVKNFSDINFAVLGRAGHLLHLEQPELFRTHVSDWMARVRDGMERG